MNVKSLCASVLSIVTVGIAIYLSSHTDQNTTRSSVYASRNVPPSTIRTDMNERQ